MDIACSARGCVAPTMRYCGGLEASFSCIVEGHGKGLGGDLWSPPSENLCHHAYLQIACQAPAFPSGVQTVELYTPGFGSMNVGFVTYLGPSISSINPDTNLDSQGGTLTIMVRAGSSSLPGSTACIIAKHVHCGLL